jgi:hypothetical protein
VTVSLYALSLQSALFTAGALSGPEERDVNFSWLALGSLIQRSTPAGRLGDALGVRTMVLNVSHTMLPLIFGGIGTALGMGAVFWSMARIVGAGGLLANRLKSAD